MRPDRAGPAAGVVLAAGASARMGANKLFLQLDGESILMRAAKRAVAAGLDPVIVVLGHEAERARTEVAGLPVRTVLNPDYGLGINRSLKVGIGAVPVEARAAVVLLADMPFVTDGMIARLVERFRASDARIVVSDYAGIHAPPTLYDRSLFAELGALEAEGCGKQVVRRHRSEAVAVAWPAAALADVDRPEDWERIRMELAASEGSCAVIS
ncbi:MAG: nucleotidyltransferase family protein [Thermoanaerobaculia bacterium]